MNLEYTTGINMKKLLFILLICFISFSQEKPKIIKKVKYDGQILINKKTILVGKIDSTKKFVIDSVIYLEEK